MTWGWSFLHFKTTFPLPLWSSRVPSIFNEIQKREVSATWFIQLPKGSHTLLRPVVKFIYSQRFPGQFLLDFSLRWTASSDYLTDALFLLRLHSFGIMIILSSFSFECVMFPSLFYVKNVSLFTIVVALICTCLALFIWTGSYLCILEVRNRFKGIFVQSPRIEKRCERPSSFSVAWLWAGWGANF